MISSPKDIIISHDLSVIEYHRLRESVGWVKLSDGLASKSITNAYSCLCCRINGEAVSCARMMWDGGYTFFIVDVIVHPDFQKKGIGRMMMEYLLAQVKSEMKNADDKMMVNLYAAIGKENFYKKFGFSSGTGMYQWFINQ